jgi:hypothetical protein
MILPFVTMILLFIVQIPCIKPHPKILIHQSTYISRPLAYKCANSESISQPSPSSQYTKKAYIVATLPVNSRWQQIVPDNIDEEEQFNKDEDYCEYAIVLPYRLLIVLVL